MLTNMSYNNLVSDIVIKLTEYISCHHETHHVLYFTVVWKAVSFHTNMTCRYCFGYVNNYCDYLIPKDLVYMFHLDITKDSLDEDLIVWLQDKTIVAQTKTCQHNMLEDDIMLDDRGYIEEITTYDLNHYYISEIHEDTIPVQSNDYDEVFYYS